MKKYIAYLIHILIKTWDSSWPLWTCLPTSWCRWGCEQEIPWDSSWPRWTCLPTSWCRWGCAQGIPWDSSWPRWTCLPTSWCRWGCAQGIPWDSSWPRWTCLPTSWCRWGCAQGSYETLLGLGELVYQPLGADEVVHKESHETLLGLGELVATVAEELLCLFVEQRAVDRLVRLVLQTPRKIII